MNERIKVLIEQANELDYETFDEYNHKTVQHYKFDKEKFAQLIVFECIKVAVFKDSGTISTAEVAGWMAAGRSTAAKMIKEHFGVEL